MGDLTTVKCCFRQCVVAGQVDGNYMLLLVPGFATWRSIACCDAANFRGVGQKKPCGKDAVEVQIEALMGSTKGSPES
jgi:hypothetical protein